MELWNTFSGMIAGLSAGVIGFALVGVPRTPVRLPLFAFVTCGVLWVTGNLITDSADGMVVEQIGIAVLYTGAIFMAPLWWMIALRWAEEAAPGVAPTRPRWQHIPLAWAGAMWAAMLTNPWHGAFLTPVIGARNVYEPLWFAMAMPSYGLILAALAIEIRVLQRSARRSVRHQALYLIAASTVTLLGNLTYVTDIVPFDLTVVMLSLSAALLVVAMAYEGLFGVLPTALPSIAAGHPDGLVVTTSDGHVRYLNAQAETLLAPIPLRTDLELPASLDHPGLTPAIELASEAPGSTAWWNALEREEGVLFRKSVGRPRWLQVRANRFDRRGGRDGGYWLHISDVTASRRAELHARQRRRLESVAAVARKIAREFQGGLAIVEGNAQLLSEAMGNDADALRRLGRITEAARHGGALATHLELHTGSIGWRRTPLDLSAVMAEGCALVEDELPATLRIELRSDARLLPIEADAIQIRHALYALLQNAIEATGDRPGEIEVSTGVQRIDPMDQDDLVTGSEQPAGDYAFARVRDRAGGMDPETEERAFEPFFSTREKDRGTGLSTVLGIARAHDGLLALENAPGRGCTFTIYFPLATA